MRWRARVEKNAGGAAGEERERRTKQEQERREREERERRAREEEERRKQEERKQRKEKERLKMDLASFMGEMDRPVSLAEIMQQPRFRSLGSTQVLSLLSELCKLGVLERKTFGKNTYYMLPF